MPSPYGSFFSILFDGIRAVATEPIFKGVFSSLLAEPLIKQRPENLLDESVGDFIRRRFGVAAADNLASALFHGIYAGDIYKLSIRTLLPKLWYLEGRDPEGNSVIVEQADLTLKHQRLSSLQDLRSVTQHPAAHSLYPGGSILHLRNLDYLLGGCAMYTLSSGLGIIPHRLKEELEKFKNVDIRTESVLQSLSLDKDADRPKTMIQSEGKQDPEAFDYVVSTLRPATMANLIKASNNYQPQTPFPSEVFEKVNKATTVMVVNLYYDAPALLPQNLQGFGYLIPRSVALEDNPERALGVIFGSSDMPRGEQIRQPGWTVSEEVLKEGKEELVRMQQMWDHTEEQRKQEDAGLDEKFKSQGWSPERVRENKILRAAGWEHNIRPPRVELAEMKLVTTLGYRPGTENEWRRGQDTAVGTKLTVMLGGHWWDGWEASDLPVEQQGIKMAKSILKRHLNITDEPAVAKARLQKDCIPQYPVGYRQHMAQIHKEVLIDQFKGRVKVAGPWWQGAVGVNDCIRKARETAYAIQHAWDEHTGLEDFVGNEKWVLYNKRTGQVSIDPMCE